jgi:hypothetical protein
MKRLNRNVRFASGLGTLIGRLLGGLSHRPAGPEEACDGSTHGVSAPFARKADFDAPVFAHYADGHMDEPHRAAGAYGPLPELARSQQGSPPFAEADDASSFNDSPMTPPAPLGETPGGHPLYRTRGEAMNAALSWLVQRGFKTGAFHSHRMSQRFLNGRIDGLRSADRIGYRIEHDERHGAHINTYAGREKACFCFRGNAAEVEAVRRMLFGPAPPRR